MMPQTFTPWHFTRSDIEDVVRTIGAAELDAKSQLVLLRSAAMLARLLNAQGHLETFRKSLQRSPQWPKDGSPKYLLYEATEDFFCDYYGAVNGVRAALIRERAIFGHIPKGASGMVSWFGTRMKAEHFGRVLEHGLKFRALIEHPQLNQPYTWAVGVETPHIFLYGTPSLRGGFPQGATAEEGFYSVGADGNWSFVAPDDQLVLDYLGLFWKATVEAWIGPVARTGPLTLVPSPTVGGIGHSRRSNEFLIPETMVLRWPLEPGNTRLT